MDVFPSIMEYLRIPVRDDWGLDGRSRLELSDAPATETEQCNLTKTKPVIALSGGYIFHEEGGELDECLSETTSFGRFHYNSGSHCAANEGNTSQAPPLCTNSDHCTPDSFTYSGIIGLAKDGHIVYGS